MIISNYCVSFLDLLGQRAALQGQTLIPTFQSEEDEIHWRESIRNSIGPIASLQKSAEEVITATEPDPQSPLRSQLNIEQQAMFDMSLNTKVTTQCWSDGLMSFASLSDQSIKCHLNNIYRLFVLAGILCFRGLAAKRPIRGAIEIGWATELRSGELYGAAVARAYELESEVACYPRIIVGNEVSKFIELHCINQPTDHYEEVDRTLAHRCRNMITQDTDGHFILHYLGEGFRENTLQATEPEVYSELYAKAYDFIQEQLSTHKANKKTKLVYRYNHLLQYFNTYPVSFKTSATT